MTFLRKDIPPWKLFSVKIENHNNNSEFTRLSELLMDSTLTSKSKFFVVSWELSFRKTSLMKMSDVSPKSWVNWTENPQQSRSSENLLLAQEKGSMGGSRPQTMSFSHYEIWTMTIILSSSLFPILPKH